MNSSRHIWNKDAYQKKFFCVKLITYYRKLLGDETKKCMWTCELIKHGMEISILVHSLTEFLFPFYFTVHCLSML